MCYPPPHLPDLTMDQALIKETLEHLLAKLNLEFSSVSLREDGNMIRAEIDSSKASRIIGWHGETLNSIQHVLKSIIRTKLKLDRAPFIMVDVDGYRKTQEDKVCTIAEKKADFVRRTGNRVALSPMSPYFRRVVHLFVANNEQMADLTTESVGEGDYRQIILRLKDEKKRSGNDSGEELTPVMDSDDGLDNLDV